MAGPGGGPGVHGAHDGTGGTGVDLESISLEELEERASHLSRLEGVMLDTYRAELRAHLEDPSRLTSVYATTFLAAELREQVQAVVDTAAKSLNAPIAALNLITDSQQICVAACGPMTVGDHSRPIRTSYCQHVVGTARPFLVDDALSHALVCQYPTTENGLIRSYLGVPLITPDQSVIGSLCVVDDQPRKWGAGDVMLLTQLAAVVMRLRRRALDGGV